MRDWFDRRSKRGRAARYGTAVVLGILCAEALNALGVPRELSVIPISALIACLLMLPRHPN